MMLVQHPMHPPEPSQTHPASSPSPPPKPTPNTTSAFPSLPASASAPTLTPLQLTKTQWESSKLPAPKPITTTKPNFTLRPATLDDAPQIARLGGGTFAATFGFSMPAADMNAYLLEAYSPDAISDDISSSGKHFLVAATTTSTSSATASADPSSQTQTALQTSSQTSSQTQTEPETQLDPARDAKLIGFAQLTELTTEPCLSHYNTTETIELQRLYVSRDAQGLGVGKTLMSAIETKARDLGYRYMWLGVWEGNFIAQRVYESCGFERVGDHEFRMGRCIQTDWIMVKKLWA